jgi:hypothetical protein
MCRGCSLDADGTPILKRHHRSSGSLSQLLSIHYWYHLLARHEDCMSMTAEIEDYSKFVHKTHFLCFKLEP